MSVNIIVGWYENLIVCGIPIYIKMLEVDSDKVTTILVYLASTTFWEVRGFMRCVA